MTKYFAFAASAFQTRLAYRTEVWANIFGQLISIFVRVAIWTAAYQNIAIVGGATLADMTTYAIITTSVLGAWRHNELIYEVGESIKTGNVAIYLLKPLHYPLYLLAGEFGRLLCQVLIVAVPVVIIACLIFGLKAPASAFHGAMFVAFWLLAFGILFLMATLCGLLAFWLMTTFSLDWSLTALLTIFSGSFIPLWLFPDSVAATIGFLPFAWVAFYPMAVYLGKLAVTETWLTLGIGLVWLGVLTLAVLQLWRQASLRLTIQGG